ncbi:calpain-1 catalytic subunit-like [Parambassis ranga]|uniref:Calpain-1 catalytic subunit-like n=1 Tax=Parambassis ranga TaxID=210632 RepID=A0A6P7HHW1_9TELE|nr:calpain-1 catalytic subunit-like [Parambassis ranga]
MQLSCKQSSNPAAMPPPGVCLNIIEARQKQDGRGSFNDPVRFFNQDYKEWQQYCLINQVLYRDEIFPPDNISIGTGIEGLSDLSQVVWERPRNIITNPSFVLDGLSRFDFGQGLLGNCWFLASIGALTFQKHILGQVVPLEQAFDENYCGIFHFRFWRFGKWVDVVIDDKLPTINGRLIFVHSKNQHEFWPALLEKAYAKVCGSYADMIAGTPAEAMMDFTGGVHIYVDLSEPPSDLFNLLCRAGQSKTLIGCSTCKDKTYPKPVFPNGLVQGHAYTVTGVKQMMNQGNLVNLVRLWNPWGDTEWNGDWCDWSPLWQTVSGKDRETCLSIAEDGEFWMSLEDFCKWYTSVDICGLSPDFLDEDSSCIWKTSMYEGRWVAGTTAGGCNITQESFWTNPQFRVTISGEESEKDSEKNVLVSLMQAPEKRNRRRDKNLNVGFSIFKVTEQYRTHRGKFPPTFFNNHTLVALSKTFYARETLALLKLGPGEYLIVPSTFYPNESASFILTIHSKTETPCYENSGDYRSESGERLKTNKNAEEDENRRTFFRQHSDKYEEVDAEQLQRLLNENILKGDLKSGGFSIDACRSMVALMDTSITGKLNLEEFIRLWRKVNTYKDMFFRTDVSRTGTLSLSELRNAFEASELKINDSMLNLMAVRYGASSGHMTLECFISLILRLECMHKIFQEISDGKSMNLRESEWMLISMYT